MKAMLIAQNSGSSKTLTLQGVLYSQYFRNKAIGRSRTSMCYTTPGHPVQCAVQDHKRILPVFVKYPVRHLRSRIHPVVWLAPKYAMFQCIQIF